MLPFRILAGSVRDEERVTVTEPEESKIAWLEFCDVGILALQLPTILGDLAHPSRNCDLRRLSHQRAAAGGVLIEEMSSMKNPV